MVAALLLSCLAAAPPGDDARVEPQQCGLYALASAATFAGLDRPFDRWANALATERAPFSLADLEAAARSAGLDTYLLRWLDVLAADLDCPCVLHVKATESSPVPDHFVACFGTNGDDVCLGDYPGFPTLVPREKLRRFWDGTALYVASRGDPQFARLRRGAWAELVEKAGVIVFALVCCIGIWPFVRGTAVTRRWGWPSASSPAGRWPARACGSKV